MATGSYLNFHVLTFNVAGTDLSPHDIESLFAPQESLGLTDSLIDIDVLVIGLQEAYQSVQSAVTALVPLVGSDNHVDSFSKFLCTKGFARLQFCRLLGIVIMAFVKRPLLCYVNNVSVSSFRTGLAGLWGNKGAASIRFRLGNISLAFSNCHLVPHEENNERRGTDLHDIILYQVFNINGLGSVKLFDHDVVVLFGDLNYRLEATGFDEIITSLTSEDKASLFKRDQLRLEQVKGDLSSSFLHKFMEMEINFEPSYKYEPGTDRFDLSKGRPPAWCDRVLWTIHKRRYPKITDSEPRSVVKPVSYGIHMQPKVSDHRAVSARLGILSNVNTNPKVIFRMSEWFCEKYGNIEFDIMVGTEVSQWDWIGLYPADFVSVDSDYVYWIYTPAMRGTVGSIQYYKKSLSPDKVPGSPGMYILVYYSSHYKCVTGMSPVFRIMTS